ncbi:MAG: peptidylprolyl isomerase [Gammaproteobacteria bacterium]|nr:MAG: peptidylprolyl isomerase [Gammaproteobacteria bacterium]
MKFIKLSTSIIIITLLAAGCSESGSDKAKKTKAPAAKTEAKAPAAKNENNKKTTEKAADKNVDTTKEEKPAEKKPIDPNAAVATVNGVKITNVQVDTYIENFFRSQGRPPVPLNNEQRAQIIDQLVTMEALSQKAQKEGIKDDKKISAIISNNTRQVYAGMFMEKYRDGLNITDEKIKALYDEKIANAPKEKEYNADHILVKTEEEAKAIITELNNKGDFAKIAKEKSTGPSSKSGGKLGWFSTKKMVKQFSEATVNLKKGEISQAPVKTQYGWHVIKLNDIRDATPISFDEFKKEESAKIIKTEIEKYIKLVKSESEITIK